MAFAFWLRAQDKQPHFYILLSRHVWTVNFWSSERINFHPQNRLLSSSIIDFTSSNALSIAKKLRTYSNYRNIDDGSYLFQTKT